MKLDDCFVSITHGYEKTYSLMWMIGDTAGDGLIRVRLASPKPTPSYLAPGDLDGVFTRSMCEAFGFDVRSVARMYAVSARLSPPWDEAEHVDDFPSLTLARRANGKLWVAPQWLHREGTASQGRPHLLPNVPTYFAEWFCRWTPRKGAISLTIHSQLQDYVPGKPITHYFASELSSARERRFYA